MSDEAQILVESIVFGLVCGFMIGVAWHEWLTERSIATRNRLAVESAQARVLMLECIKARLIAQGASDDHHTIPSR